ncbi:hypothetical protein KQI69_06120 [Eubacterium sp. MSJ-13]|uniref:DUF6142 family protein n=1 Tax=Eubacterium sp. MSJ-13 TaxID=2841513 RepID=UPI001C11DDB4|nr:DUF6142 family protein [Eubacterium sp. MSJ-13]MBU5478777.1 hypothetical protein [Eubacterium sp. MSJ-13]
MFNKNKKKRKRDGELRLTDKKHPISGIWSVVIGVFALSMFIATCIMSGGNGGNGGMIVGVVGILCFIISITGFILSWMSLRKENIRYFFPTIGAVVNGLQIVGYMVVYICGSYM